MKLLVIFSILASTTVFAADAKPLISKHSGAGFVMPEYAFSESCEVFANEVVITKNYGRGEKSTTLVEKRNVTISPNLATRLAGIAQEPLEKKPNGMCDGPTTSINVGDTAVFFTGACGSSREERQGPLSLMAKDIVNMYCPNTFDVVHD